MQHGPRGPTEERPAAILTERTDCMVSPKGFGPLEKVLESHTAESAEAPYCASKGTE